MKLTLTIALLTLLFGAATPALQSASQDPRFTVKMDPPPDEDSIESDFTITNQSSVSITAVLVACDTRPAANGDPRFIRGLADSVIENDFSELFFGESTTIEMHRPDFLSMHCKQDSSVRAVLFKDGTSFGEPNWVNEIIQARLYNWQKSGDLLNILQTAKDSGTTKSKLNDQFLMMERRVIPTKMPSPTDSSLGTTSIYDDVWRNLGRDTDYPNDSPVSQALVDELSEPVLDLRQRLLYSKPPLPGLPNALDPAGAPAPDFTIKLPGGLGSGTDSIGDMISVFYTLSAKGQNDKELFDRDFPEKEPKTFHISTLVGGHPASSLRIAVYAPGCQIKTINVPDLSNSSGSESFECIPLPTIRLTGQVLPSSLLDGKKYIIKIKLDSSTSDAVWSDLFLADDVAPDQNGLFHIDIPDFSQDPSCAASGAVLKFVTAYSSVGPGKLSDLAAVNSSADSNGNLRLISNYGAVVSFQATPPNQR
jgi:hypothetical protein